MSEVDRDPTEEVRKLIIAARDTVLHDLSSAEIIAGIKNHFPDACNTDELQEQYTVNGFMAPFISCTRKSDGKKGMMEFLHNPRIYFDFTEV